jgi:hypothetical protein
MPVASIRYRGRGLTDIGFDAACDRRPEAGADMHLRAGHGRRIAVSIAVKARPETDAGRATRPSTSHAR